MKSWSIPLGRIFGVELRVHWTFLILLAYVLATESATTGMSGAWRGLALVAIVFGSVIVHELAHALVSLRLKIPVRGIMLLPIGGVTLTDPSADEDVRDPQKEVQVSLAGPMVNLVMGLIGAAVVLSLYPHPYLWARPLVDTGALPRSVVWANLFLGAFNLLPAFPMDGGRVLRGWLAQRTDFYSATRKAVLLGQVCAMAFFLGGMWYPWLMVIGLFIFFGAQMEERSLAFKSVLDNVTLEDVMLTDFSTLSPADTLEDALAKATHTLQDDFPVIRGSDMVGVISRRRIADALRGGGNAYVQSAMERAYDVGERGETLASAFRKLTGRGRVNLLPVVDNDRLIGIVTLQNLTHSIGMVAETRRSRLFGR